MGNMYGVSLIFCSAQLSSTISQVAYNSQMNGIWYYYYYYYMVLNEVIPRSRLHSFTVFKCKIKSRCLTPCTTQRVQSSPPETQRNATPVPDLSSHLIAIVARPARPSCLPDGRSAPRRSRAEAAWQWRRESELIRAFLARTNHSVA